MGCGGTVFFTTLDFGVVIYSKLIENFILLFLSIKN